MSDNNRYRLTLYSAQKAKEHGGRGNTSVMIKYNTPEEKQRKIKERKELQKKRNKEWKEQYMNDVRDGKPIEIEQRVFNISTPKVKSTLRIKLDRGLHNGKSGDTILLNASAKSGKTTLIKHIWSKQFNKKNIITTLFSPSAHIPIFRGMTNVLKSSTFGKQGSNYIDMQRYINQHTSNRYKFVNIFDDVIDIRYNNTLNRAILTDRNSNISTIISLQYCRDLAKRSRSSVNNVLFGHLNTNDDIEQTIQAFLKPHFRKLGMTNMNEMVDFYNRMTANYGWIYLKPATGELTFHRLTL